MLRKMVIALVAAAAVTAGSMVTASAMHGGGGHGGGGMGHGGFGHGGGGFAHAGFARHGGFGGFAGTRPIGFHHGFHGGFHDGRFAFRHHHRVFFNRFAFYGAAYPYDDSCYRRVWTRWGWRWASVCY